MMCVASTAMLAKKDMYVYDIKQEITKRSEGEFVLRDGSMYGPIYRMLERGLISCRQEMVGEKRFRKYYHLKQLGNKYISYCIDRFYKLFHITDTIISESIDCSALANNDAEDGIRATVMQQSPEM